MIHLNFSTKDILQLVVTAGNGIWKIAVSLLPFHFFFFSFGFYVFLFSFVFSCLCGFVLLGSMIHFSSTAGVHSHSSSSTFPFSLMNKDRITFSVWTDHIFITLFFLLSVFLKDYVSKAVHWSRKRTLHSKLTELFMSERTWEKKIIAKMKQLREEERKRLKTSLSSHQPSNPFLLCQSSKPSCTCQHMWASM